MPSKIPAKCEDAAEQKQPENWFLANLKNQSAAVFIAVLWACYTFIGDTRTSGTEIKNHLEANSKAIEKLAVADKEQSELQTQFMIGLTKSSESINRMALDVRDLQQQQQKLTEQLLNRK